MASIKSILAAVDRVEFVDATADIWYGPAVNIAGLLRPSGHTNCHSLELALAGRLGKIGISVEIYVDYLYQHNDEGDLIGTITSSPSVVVTDMPKEITSTEILRTLNQIGCNLQSF